MDIFIHKPILTKLDIQTHAPRFSFANIDIAQKYHNAPSLNK